MRFGRDARNQMKRCNTLFVNSIKSSHKDSCLHLRNGCRNQYRHHHNFMTTRIQTRAFSALNNNTINTNIQKIKSDEYSTSSGKALFLLLSSICGITAIQNGVFDKKSEYTALEALPPQIVNDENDEDVDETTTVINWSGTHSIEVPNQYYFEPETVSELESIVAKCQKEKIPIRPVGSALSPNAISFQPKGMISMANMDQIINIDKENMTVTVQAGARVSQVVDALRPHGLTLPNLASIAEQQMGGFTQIGAHGTGANISPVDDFVTSLKMVTPAKGTVELTEKDGEMFHLAKVGLGCFGIVSEITMECIPSHKLLEHTYVLTRAQAKENLNELLKKHKHIRYMWIPYQDAVVVVTNDPEDENSADIVKESIKNNSTGGNDDNMKPLKDLLKELAKNSDSPYTDEMLDEKGFGELRDALLSFKPLSGQHVKTVNKAEAEFWRQSEGYQLKPSDQLLQFDCGGQVCNYYFFIINMLISDSFQ